MLRVRLFMSSVVALNKRRFEVGGPEKFPGLLRRYARFPTHIVCQFSGSLLVADTLRRGKVLHSALSELFGVSGTACGLQ